MCAIMLRGRHRGLPLKVDRSIMLPKEFEQNKREHLRRLRASRLGLASGLLRVDVGMASSTPTLRAAGAQMTPRTPERLAIVRECPNEKEEGEGGGYHETHHGADGCVEDLGNGAPY